MPSIDSKIMNNFALALISCWIIYVYSQADSTQQVTLSCPANTEAKRGPAGVPGKRGSKGDNGSRGE